MKTLRVSVVVCLLSLMGAMIVSAQKGAAGASASRSPSVTPHLAPAPPTTSVLRLIKFSGSAVDAQGQPPQGTVGVTFALYADQQGGTPLWLETQNVTLDKQGRYTALLGAMSNEGLPLGIFASGEARWLGITVQGQPEQPRVLLVAVPYALKAAEAETLSGKKASDFVTTEQLPEQVQKVVEEQKTGNAATSASSTTTSGGGKTVVTSGATNFTDTTTDQVVKVTQNGTGYALLAVGTNSNGIFGATQAANSNVYGLFGQTIGEKGGALIGFANSATGTAVGVQGVAKSATGTAGAFVNTAGGTILLGRSASNAEVFRLDGTGLLKVNSPGGTQLFSGQNNGSQVFSVSGTGEITSHGFLVTPNVTSVNGTSPNVLTGASVNSITSGVVGATIGGGGDSNFPHPNLVTDDFGTVGGGSGNQAGDNAGSTNDRAGDTVAGGRGNTARGGDSAVGGGINNTASEVEATVGGGGSNAASGVAATVGGGLFNTASGSEASVPGGGSNTAQGSFSFAAGNRAKALHDGAFVWGDSTGADVNSTAANQFTIRASGGFRMVTGFTPTEVFSIDPSGNITANNLILSGSPSFTGNSASPVVTVTQNGSGSALVATTASAATGGTVDAVRGEATSSAGNTKAIGVHGVSASDVGRGVKGEATGTAGIGVEGITSSTFVEVAGVRGEATGSSGQVFGVRGISTTSTGGIGVRGEGSDRGVEGLSISGIGVQGSGATAGVRGFAVSGKAVYGTASSLCCGIGVLGESTFTGAGVVYGVKGTIASSETNSAAVFGEATSLVGSTIGVYGKSAGTNGIGVLGEVVDANFTNFGVKGTAQSGNGTGVAGIGTNGAVGVLGQSDTDAAGDFNCTSCAGSTVILLARIASDTKFKVLANGNVLADGTFTGGGADFAESVAVTGAKEGYQPGDVLVVDPSGNRRFALSSQPYSRLVAGIYSTKPGMMGRQWAIDDPRLAEEIPLAIVGIVPCKVTAENGPIEQGDLLVTSSARGYAMKGTDGERMLGAVVGKALQPLASGTGVIEVLVTLQ